MSNATTLQSDSSCNMACTGNPSEVCGGPALLTVYYANTPVPQGPHTNNGPAGWTSSGCWLDGSTKALANEVQVDGGGSNMTVTGCTAACGAAGYKLAGIEYASKTRSRTAALNMLSLTLYLQASATATTSFPETLPMSPSKSATCHVMATPASSAAPATE